MTVQDDRREIELIKLFNLERAPDAGRSDTDAYLKVNGKNLPFELKSTTTGSVTTVRDFGPDHIKKWKEKHWLIGVYNPTNQKLQYCLYGSIKMMAPWISEKEEYIRADWELSKEVPDKITMDILIKIVGKKKIYTFQDAVKLQKKQYSIQKYKSLMDVDSGYSPQRMLEILKDRCKYLLQRGSTLNNPHIPQSYFEEWEKITGSYAETLRKIILQHL